MNLIYGLAYLYLYLAFHTFFTQSHCNANNTLTANAHVLGNSRTICLLFQFRQRQMNNFFRTGEGLAFALDSLSR